MRFYQQCIVLWTSMRRRNADKIYTYFKQIGLKFEKLYCQQSCSEDMSKDLRIVAQDYGVGVQHVYLIDDSPKKRIQDQNFIRIQKYEGIQSEDKQLIRITKNLYELLQIPYQSQFDQDEQLFRLQNMIKTFKFQKPVEKEEKKNQFKNENNGEKKSYKQKNQKQKVVKEEKKQIKFTKNTKVVVFDLSKTLIAKKKDQEQRQDLQFLKNPSKIQGNIIYNRPHINVLRILLDSHKNDDIMLLVWTTMTGKAAVAHCRQVVNNLDAPFEDVINGVTSKDSAEKDLQLICEKYGAVLENIILVDDSTYKQKNGQNFINIWPYYGDANDIEMIRTVAKIDEFIGCKQECAIKKLAKTYEKQLIESKQYQVKSPQVQPKEQEIQQKIELGYKVKLDIKQNRKIKCIVFDINQTLLVRAHEKVEGVNVDARNKHYFIYLRPYLQDLIQFLELHGFVVCLWSTIKLHNCEIFRKLLSEKGLKIQELFAGDQLVNGIKDLQLVSDKMGIPLQEIALVDDSSKKRMPDQNFVHICSFEPGNQQDDALLELIRQLDKISCDNQDCKFKLL